MKGKRKRGRQKKRWEDNIKEWTGMDFVSSTRDSISVCIEPSTRERENPRIEIKTRQPQIYSVHVKVIVIQSNVRKRASPFKSKLLLFP